MSPFVSLHGFVVVCFLDSVMVGNSRQGRARWAEGLAGNAERGVSEIWFNDGIMKISEERKERRGKERKNI